jgi:DNA repair protein RecN (Recombination protein N)
MLQELSIQNYAIIDELEIAFSVHLNVITGETGAGKSIIAGALGLILGERADTSVLVNKDKKCVVEGKFETAGKKEISLFLRENDFDVYDELIIRREIGTNGKSRAFVNDTPVNLSHLNQLSTLLVDLHQQFDTLSLGESDFQREVLDALAGNGEPVSTYRQSYQRWQAEKKDIDNLKTAKQQFDKEADYNRFQFNELEEASFKSNELEEIDAELKMLANSEGIKAALAKVYYELQENDTPLVEQLKSLINQLQAFASFHNGLPPLLQRLQATRIELKDIADEIEGISNHINYDAGKIEQLNERLSMGYKLLKKHGVKSTNELLQVKNMLEEKLQAVFDMDARIGEKEKVIEKMVAALQVQAIKISEGRKKQVKPFEEKVHKLLKQVGMPNARLKVDLITGTALNPFGLDTIEFLFDANKSGAYQPVKKVASGGELSRLMLCIKSLVARSIDLPTLIFDEIDTGISGEAARQVGIILKDLAATRQVICITHQPQIAGKADLHFFVYKEVIRDKVKTNIRRLTADERVTAIAKMLSGEKPTAAAIENAREMVEG